jgi:steroid delta-isomerase-like uncharacterized protein
MPGTTKRIIQRFYAEIYNQGDLGVADELVAVGYVNHYPAPGEASGLEGFKAFVAYLRRAFADFQITVEDQIAEGDKVVTRFTISGRHEGEFAGFPPSGRRISVPGIAIHRIIDGQIREGWFNWDALGLMQQLRNSD